MQTTAEPATGRLNLMAVVQAVSDCTNDDAETLRVVAELLRRHDFELCGGPGSAARFEQRQVTLNDAR